MDLDRGQCFCCNANKILVHEKPEVCEKLFLHLFGKVDFKDVKEKLLLLKWCPLCFQKLLTVLKDLDNIKNLKSDSEEDECIICRTDKYLVKIEKLPHIVKSLEELGVEGVEQICLNCIYILDVRHTIKEKICSKHPHLKARHRKTQASNELPPVTKRSKRKAAQVIEISDTEEPTSKSSITNISIFKKLKPLKYDDFFGNIEIIHSDPKFYAQIPYTKLQIYSAKNDLSAKGKHHNIAPAVNDDSPKKNIFFKIKFKSHNNKYSIVKNKHSKQKTRSNSLYSEKEELKKHNISSSLVVNLDKSTDVSLILTDDDSKMDTSEITPENEEVSVTSENEPVEDEVDSNKEKSLGNENIEDSITIESDDEISVVTTANKSSQVSNEHLDFVENSDITGNNEKSDDKLEEKREEQSENVDVEGVRENKEELNETKCESKPKRSRPKPLSKQKKNKDQRDIEEVVEEIPKPEEKKKYKPGPLSRKRKRESKCVELDDDESKNLDETKCSNVEENSHLNKNDEKDTTEEIADISEESKDTTEEIADISEESKDKVVEIVDSEENDKSEENESVDVPEEVGNADIEQEEKDKDEEEISVQEDCSTEKSDKEENSAERDDKTDKTDDKTELETEEIEDKTDKTDDTAEIETKEDEEVIEKDAEKDDNEETESKTNDTDEDNTTVDLTEVENDSSEVTNGDVDKEKLSDEKDESKDDDNDKINLDEFVDASNGEERTSLVKRKCDDEKSEGIFSPDKKKKRVTFSDEVLESSYD